MNVKVNQADDHILVRFDRPCRVLSSAVLNGGLVEACQVLNMAVMPNFHGQLKTFVPPEKTLQDYADALQLSGATVGMMTSASMKSFRSAVERCEPYFVKTIVTSGISNAKRAGEAAEYRHSNTLRPTGGTINMITMIDAFLTDSALVEAVMIVTEAKAATLQDLAIASAVTGAIATGTGTDAVAVVSNATGRPVRYCGKHVLLGEKLARTVNAALMASLCAWPPPGGKRQPAEAVETGH